MKGLFNSPEGRGKPRDKIERVLTRARPGGGYPPPPPGFSQIANLP